MPKLSELNPSTRRTILAYGDSGTGKTVFALSAPGPHYVFDVDGKLSSAAAFYSADKERLSAVEYDDYRMRNEADRPAQRFEAKLREFEKQASEAGKTPFPYATVILDSFTTFTDMMLREVVLANPMVQRTKSPTAHIPAMLDYRIQNIHIKQLLSRLLALPCNVIILAHIKTEKDELTGRIATMPNAPGGLAAYLPVVFEEVYRTYVEVKANKRHYMAQTQADSQFIARSQIPNIPGAIELAWGNLR